MFHIMRFHVLAALAATLAIAGCTRGDPGQSPAGSVTAEAAAAAPQPEQPLPRPGWRPADACAFLEPTLATRGYKHDFDDQYHCASPYLDIGRPDARLANNLAYYVTGHADVADTLKLVLNYNQPDNAIHATQGLVVASQALSRSATGNDLPPGILSALSEGRAALEASGRFQHEVKRIDWPTGRGYEVHYVTTKAAGR